MVQVRFDYTGTNLSFWALGDVQVGTPACAAAPGGLVAGVVHDANTSQPVNGATVTSKAHAGGSGTSAATGDPSLPGGYYWLFSPHAGPRSFTAAAPSYAKATATVAVAADAVTQQGWALQAGQLTADASSLSASQTLGQSGTARVTFRNGGAAPLHVRFGAQDGGFTPLTQESAKSTAGAGHQTDRTIHNRDTQTAASGSTWSSIASLPAGVINNAVAYDPQTRQVYSVGGGGPISHPNSTDFGCPASDGGPSASGYVYSPAAKTWQPIAALPQPLESPSAAFLDGTLYVAGGFNCDLLPSTAVYAYTPGARTWQQVTSLPAGLAGLAAAVLNGQLYVIGGCAGPTAGSSCRAESRAVYRYDPAAGSWAKLADYPAYGGVAFEACAGLDGEIACAGGLQYSSPVNSTFLYNPVSNTWTQGTGMPYSAYQMASAGSGGQLQVAGGVIDADDDLTDRVSQYNPATNSWTALASLPTAQWGSDGSCGMYVVGGSDMSAALSSAEVLSGYSQCDGAGDTGWLPTPRGFTLQPGQSLTVEVTVDAAEVDQPGTYTADLYAASNTPYPNTVIPVTLTVNPPKGWGLLSGKVTTSAGKPIAGATVQVGTTCTAADYCGKQSCTLTAGEDGSWQWWLPTSDNRLLVIAAKDGYIQQVARAAVHGGKTLTLNTPLAGYQPPMG